MFEPNSRDRNARKALRIASKRGQTMMLFVLGFATMLALLGLVFDGGRIYFEKRHMQAAADAGAFQRIASTGQSVLGAVLFDGNPTAIVFGFDEFEYGFPAAQAFAYWGVEFGFFVEVFELDEVDTVPVFFHESDGALCVGQFDKVARGVAGVAHGKHFVGI